VTRPSGRGAGLAEILARLGAEVALRPTISFVPPGDGAKAERAARRAGSFDWIVFTSPTGVRFFAEQASRAGIDPAGLRCRIAAVGPGTARALESARFIPAVVARRGDAEGLAAELAPQVREGETVLAVQPETAGTTLVKALGERGAQVDAVPFYRTVPAKECAEISGEIESGAYDAVVFTSPSTFLSLLKAGARGGTGLRVALAAMARVAIGRITAGALAGEGLPPDRIASRPDDEAVADALVEALERR
jgi:uroporphyrinogen-III synthase